MKPKLTREQLAAAKLAKQQKKRELEELKSRIVPDQLVSKPSPEIVQTAGRLLSGKYRKLVLGNLISMILGVFAAVPVFGWTLLYGAVVYGKTRFAIETLEGKNPGIAVLFSGFNRPNYPKLAAYGARKSFLLLAWAILLVVPAIVEALEYSLSTLLLVQKPELSGSDSMNRSKGMMHANRRKYVLGGLLPALALVLGILTLGIGWIFLQPFFFAHKYAFANEIGAKLNENPPSADSILEIRNVRKYFPTNTDLFGRPLGYVRAVDDVSFAVGYGKTLGIVGESGCGKTTLGRTILGLHEITSGSVYFGGRNVGMLMGSEQNKLRTDMQVIFQDPYSSLSPRMAVGEIIGEGVRVHNIVKKSEHRAYVLDVMQKCGLQPHYYDRYPHEFSGGQRQRICIARALAVQPKFVVCDEPVSALDVSIQAQIINLLMSLQREMNLTYLFISHDLSVVEHISDEVGVMYLGSMVEKGETEDIFKNPMHPYTRALLSAVPVPDPKVKMNRTILRGDIPSPANPPKGCKFHTRCFQCMEICRTQVPVLRDYGGGHLCACHLYEQGEENNG